MEQFLWKHIFFNSFSLALVVPKVPLGPTGPAPLPCWSKQLGWLGSWTPAQTAYSELELNLPLNLLRTVLSNSSLLFYCSISCCSVLICKCGPQGLALHGPQRYHWLSLPKCNCWFVTTEMQICNEPHIRGGSELPWIPAYVWLLRNTSQYYKCIVNPVKKE
jgi:hypothetical protein